MSFHLGLHAAMCSILMPRQMEDLVMANLDGTLTNLEHPDNFLQAAYIVFSKLG